MVGEGGQTRSYILTPSLKGDGGTRFQEGIQLGVVVLNENRDSIFLQTLASIHGNLSNGTRLAMEIWWHSRLGFALELEFATSGLVAMGDLRATKDTCSLMALGLLFAAPALDLEK